MLNLAVGNTARRHSDSKSLAAKLHTLQLRKSNASPLKNGTGTKRNQGSSGTRKASTRRGPDLLSRIQPSSALARYGLAGCYPVRSKERRGNASDPGRLEITSPTSTNARRRSKWRRSEKGKRKRKHTTETAPTPATRPTKCPAGTLLIKANHSARKSKDHPPEKLREEAPARRRTPRRLATATA
jgi:hypothetical protein